MSLSSWPPTGHDPNNSKSSAPSQAAAGTETKDQVFDALLRERLKLLPAVQTVRRLEEARWRGRFKRAL